MSPVVVGTMIAIVKVMIVGIRLTLKADATVCLCQVLIPYI